VPIPGQGPRRLQRLIPASDVSNQISTAGYEASGSSNMKFMMNGAFTIGTRDGATIEMAEEGGGENFFLIFSDHFSRDEPGVFAPLRDVLLTQGDSYMQLADTTSYLEADHRLVTLYADSEEWARKAILNVASSAKFSSDRTFAEYAANIWHV